MTGRIEAAHVAHLLPGYIAGTLDAADHGDVLSHLAGCPACLAELAAWRVIQRATQEMYHEAPLTETDDNGLLQLWRRIDATANSEQSSRLPAPSTVPDRHEPSAPAGRRSVLASLIRRPIAHWATAALIVLVLAGSFLAFGPGRSWRMEHVPAILPAIGGTPATPEAVVTETLLDTAVAALPAGRLRVAVDRWHLQPSPAAVTLPAHEGAVFITVDTGEITVSTGEENHRLAARDALDVTNQEFAFRASGSTEAIAYVVYGTPRFSAEFGQGAARIWKNGDPLVHAMDFVISSSASDLPGGAGRLLLERVTLPPETALPPSKSDPLVWTEVGSGVLGLTLEGERLPYRWESGTERKFFQFGREPLPFLAAGTTMTLRNAGDEPLVIYRLTLTPGEAKASDTTPPSQSTPRPP